MFVAKVVCGPAGMKTPHDGRYIVAWNPHVPFGTLAVESTRYIQQAKRMSMEELHADYTAVSNRERYRPDGGLNRPLHAITIEIVAVDVDAGIDAAE